MTFVLPVLELQHCNNCNTDYLNVTLLHVTMLQIMYKIFDEMGIFLLYFKAETRRLVMVLWKFPAFWRGKNRVGTYDILATAS